MLDERLQLTVLLERSNDTLRIEYYDARSRSLVDRPVTAAWASIGTDFVYRSPDTGKDIIGLDGINAALDNGDRDELVTYFTQARLVEVGHILFYTLLGNSEQWEPVIRKLYDEPAGPRPNPPRRAVRVRIFTSTPDLVDLPWRLAAWKGKFLAEHGWTFEVVTSPRAEPDIELETPCAILVIAPDVREMPALGADEHIQSLRQILPAQYLGQSYLRVVKTVAEARDAFLGMNPRVLYYFGHAEFRGGQICMMFGDEHTGIEAVSANDLKQLMAGNYPRLAYINACKSGASGWHSVGYQLSPAVPVVIANATTAWTRNATLSAAAWLARCLGDGHDPVLAAHVVDDHVSTRGFEWGMRTIHASYGGWRANPLASLGPIEPIGLRLDRDSSRERAYSRVVSLVRDDDRRVQALVSYARPDSRLDLSVRQLQDHLEDHASHVAEISWRHVSFPVERGDLHGELRQKLFTALGARDSEPLEYALRRSARGPALDDSTPVLWMNWGKVLRAELTIDELAGWIYFGSELAQICPNDIRIVSYLAIETTEAADPEIDGLIADLSVEFITDEAFAIELIPPLPDVTRLDIATFLEDRNNSRCPRNLIKDVSDLLYKKTAGNYAETIRLIERAEREGWYALVSELRARPRSPGR